MNALRRRPTKKNWVRFAMKLGLLATDAAVWSSIARMITDRDEATDIRRERIASNLSPNRGWSHASTLFIGVAIGVGVGMLFAPVSGEQARNTIRDTAQDMKEKVGNISGWGTGGPSTASRRSTGTYAE
ncbi:MAG: YtxH domain-containing protein [Candidatus Sulfotelmatobacter sp.]